MYQGIVDLLANPLVWKILITYYIFSAIVGAMPTPDSNGNKFYMFLFRFMHILAGNISRAAIQFKVPGAQAPEPDPKQP